MSKVMIKGNKIAKIAKNVILVSQVVREQCFTMFPLENLDETYTKQKMCLGNILSLHND